MLIPLIDEKGKAVSIDTDEILCMYKDDKTRKFVVIANGERYSVPSTIQHAHVVLQPYGFALIDKNKLVNLTRAHDYKNGKLYVGDMEFQVSRRNREKVENTLNENRSRNINGT